MKTIYSAIVLTIGLTTISCEKKDRKVIKIDAHGTIDKSKDALKDAGKFLEKKSNEAIDVVKETAE